jgi:hypothetical protein
MSAIANETSNLSTVFYTIDDLLISLEISPASYIIYQLILPSIGLIGFIFCLINLIIFSRKNFTSPTDQYYRLISSFNVFAMLFSIPYGFCFTPKFFPNMDSYVCAIVQCVYIPYTDLIVHYVGVLEIAVMLERLKILNSFVKKHFTLTPRQMSIISFLGCLLIDAFYALNYTPVSGGDFFYMDNNGNLTQNTFYYLDTSPIALSYVGSIVLIIIYVIKNVFTIITSITLSIVSHLEMRRFFKDRQMRFNFVAIRNTNVPTIDIMLSSKPNSNEIIQVVSPSGYKNSRTNKNHLLMIIILCFITTTERVLSITCDLYFLYRIDQTAFILAALVDLAYVIGPASSFLVFYRLNSSFRSVYSSQVSLIHKKFRDIYIE